MYQSSITRTMISFSIGWFLYLLPKVEFFEHFYIVRKKFWPQSFTQLRTTKSVGVILKFISFTQNLISSWKYSWDKRLWKYSLHLQVKSSRAIINNHIKVRKTLTAIILKLCSILENSPNKNVSRDDRISKHGVISKIFLSNYFEQSIMSKAIKELLRKIVYCNLFRESKPF